ncbi:hypothetical protein [Catelliglobosispora koreensis]|uniref:hypothetical protein n=1 Tax=Catelliglobosispora koreensis TaxID=129052 RepID=UPI0003666248|nr:hypothetical protein [Catelliglobosispora koreensis]
MSRNLKSAQALTVVVAALMAVASAAGLLMPGLYREPLAAETVLRAYDLVNLVIAAPALLFASIFERRGGHRAQLAWAGTLAYVVYAYAFYVFGTAFNDAFLLHVAVFSSSLYALVLTLANTNVAGIAASFQPRTPVRTVSILLLLLALPIGAFWVFSSLRLTLTGQLPADTLLVQSLDSVHLSYVLDLALLVPAYVLAAVLLWRRAAWGYTAAAVLLISGLVHQLST